MRVDEGRISHLAESVVGALVRRHYFRAKVGEKELVARVNRIVADNLRAEQALEEEAERLAEQHARRMTGMDQHKIIDGIKTRLAKERGFPL